MSDQSNEPGPSSMGNKLRSRKSRLSIASGLSTPFDVDDIELAGQIDHDIDSSLSDSEILRQNTIKNRKDSVDLSDEEDLSGEESENEEPPLVSTFTIVWDLAKEDGFFMLSIIMILSILFVLVQLLVIHVYCSITEAEICRLFHIYF